MYLFLLLSAIIEGGNLLLNDISVYVNVCQKQNNIVIFVLENIRKVQCNTLFAKTFNGL